MKLTFPWSVGMFAVLTAVLCQNAAAQAAQSQPAPSADAQSRESKGVPPRAAPGDYQGHALAGTVTVAAEFTAHSVVTAEQLLTTEDYVVVEVGLFGPPETRLKLSYADFSVRINGKKTPVMAEEYNAVFASLKDPEWEPPESAEKKSKTSVGGNGKSDTGSLPPIVHVPIELKRAMQLRVQKASLPEGERPLPAAGLIFFPHRGKNIQSIELLYSGPAGKATVTLHP
jgi:hypothetical protein